MKMMKKDLANRSEPSVYYSDPDRNMDSAMAASQSIVSPHLSADTGLVLNNVRLSMDSQARLQTCSLPVMVKNVNVDNFKLGMSNAPPVSSACLDRVMEEGEQDYLTEQQATDVNLFLGEIGKGKVGKVDLEKMIKNNLKEDNIVRSEGGASCYPEQVETKEDPFADFESKLNVTLPKQEKM